jgi:TonB family protein
MSVLIEQGLKALLWFHPAVHLLVGRIGLAREQLVDREVVRITGNRRSYLDALWRMARVRPAPASGPALFLLNRSDLFERVALLAEEAHMSNKKTLVVAAAIVAVVGLAAASIVTMFPFAKPAVADTGEMTTTLAPSDVDDTKGEEVRHPIRYVPEGELSEPKAIHKVSPKYPEEARKEKIQGEVVAESIIDHTGKVVDTKVLESPHESLSQATIEALQQWTFEPSRNSAGEAVDVLYVVTMKYRLDAGKKPAKAAAEESAAKKQ